MDLELGQMLELARQQEIRFFFKKNGWQQRVETDKMFSETCHQQHLAVLALDTTQWKDTVLLE